MSTQEKKWTLTRKMGVVMELLRGSEAASICRANGISQSQLFEWRDKFIEAGKESLKVRKNNTIQGKKVGELEQLVGRLTMENEILKKTEQIQRRRRSGN